MDERILGNNKDTESLTRDKDFILVKKELKNYGDDRKLWYWNYQGAIFELFFNHQKGYLVIREGDDRKWLIKHKHGQRFTGKEFVKNNNNIII